MTWTQLTPDELSQGYYYNPCALSSGSDVPASVAEYVGNTTVYYCEACAHKEQAHAGSAIQVYLGMLKAGVVDKAAHGTLDEMESRHSHIPPSGFVNSRQRMFRKRG